VTIPIAATPITPGLQQGICTIEHMGRTLQFRTNPNQIWWTYRLLTKVENTYGGRVIQVLGCRIEDLIVTVECGRGGWPYLRQIIHFMRDMIGDQRKGNPGIFSYTTRGWIFRVYALSVPFEDKVNATTREIELRFKVQEDVSGMASTSTISSELSRLAAGIGFVKSPYNSGSAASQLKSYVESAAFAQ